MLFKSPYWFSHFAAVFCPTFGTPGMLSEASPTKASKSLIWLGFTPNFSNTLSSLKILCFIVSIIEIWGSSTSCIRSLSNDEMTHLYFAFFAICEIVAITSSASTPSISIRGNPIARQIDLTGANWSLRSSGIGGLLALYSEYMSLLNVFPFASKTTIIGDPSLSFFRFISIFVTPFTAPVGCPEEVLSGGMAWYAL